MQQYCISSFLDANILQNSIIPCMCDAYTLPNIHKQKMWKFGTNEALRQSVRNNSKQFCDPSKCNFSRMETIESLSSQIIQNELGKERCDAIVNYFQNNDEYLYSPMRLNLNYAKDCNMLCPTCRRDKSFFKHEHPLQKNGRFLEIVSLYGNDILDLWFNGGEPLFDKHSLSLLRSDLTKYFPNLKTLSIFTNGSLLNEKIYSSIYNRDLLHTIKMTIPGIYNDSFHRVHGSGKAVKEGMLYASKLRADNKIKYLEGNFIYQTSNFKTLPESIEECNNLGFDKLNIVYVYPWYDDPILEKRCYLKTHPQYQEHCEIINNLKKYKMKVAFEIHPKCYSTNGRLTELTSTSNSLVL